MSYVSAMHAVLTYNELYGKEIPEDKFSFLRKYPTDFIIIYLAKINAILFKKDTDVNECQDIIFKTCFSNIDAYRKGLIQLQLKKSKFENHIPLFFTSPAIIKLINLAFKNFVKNKKEFDINEVHFESNLFDSILLANLYYKELGYSEKLDSYENIWYLQLMQQRHIRDRRELFFIAPIKYMILFKYFNEGFLNGKIYLDEFNKSFHLKSFFDYISFFFKIFSSLIVGSENSAEPKIFLKLDEIGTKMIEAFALRPQDFIDREYEGKVHTDIIPHPIYYIDNDHPLILDYHFFLYIIDISLSFNYYKYSSLNLSKEFPRFEDFKSFLGKNYYEDYLLRNILSKIFTRKNFKFYTDKNFPGLLDFTIVHNNLDVFLIEVKSSAVNANIFEEIKINRLKEFIEKNFLSQKSDSNSSNKGVFQIIRFMKDLNSNSNYEHFLGDAVPKHKINIYPILIYTDKVLDMDGVNNYLNDYFQTEKGKSNFCFKYIHPLTTINYTFFMHYYATLKKNPTLLKQMLHDYWRKVKNRKKIYLKDKHPKSFLSSNISFESFASNVQQKEYSGFFKELVEDLKLTESK